MRRWAQACASCKLRPRVQHACRGEGDEPQSTRMSQRLSMLWLANACGVGQACNCIVAVVMRRAPQQPSSGECAAKGVASDMGGMQARAAPLTRGTARHRLHVRTGGPSIRSEPRPAKALAGLLANQGRSQRKRLYGELRLRNIHRECFPRARGRHPPSGHDHMHDLPLPAHLKFKKYVIHKSDESTDVQIHHILTRNLCF